MTTATRPVQPKINSDVGYALPYALDDFNKIKRQANLNNVPDVVLNKDTFDIRNIQPAKKSLKGSNAQSISGNLYRATDKLIEASNGIKNIRRELNGKAAVSSKALELEREYLKDIGDALKFINQAQAVLHSQK